MVKRLEEVYEKLPAHETSWYNVRKNVASDALKHHYEYMMQLCDGDVKRNGVASEITITVAPGRCHDIQEAKKNIMTVAIRRILRSDPVAVLLVRENHENGWPHLHGIVVYPSVRNNANTLTEGRMWVEEPVPGKDFSKKYVLFSMLGRTQVDPLRTEPYIQYDKNGNEKARWDSWFHYIVKDQLVKWQEGNCVIVRKQMPVEMMMIEDENNVL